MRFFLKKFFLVFFIGLLLYSLIGLFSHVFAQLQSFNITASPNSFDIKIQPGTSVTKSFRLRNNTDSTLPLTVTLKKLTPDQNGDVTITDFKDAESYKNWITVSSSLSALPREWTDVSFTLSVPKEAAFGYYYALFISPQQDKTQVNTPQAKLTGSLAIPILVFVEKPGAKTSGEFLQFTTNSSFYEYLPVTFSTLFANKGNVHIKPVGNIFIKDWTGKTVDSIDINKGLGSILPGGKRTFTSVWDNSFITSEPKMEDGKAVLDSKGQPQTQLQFHFDRVLSLRFGMYTAHALVVVSGQTRDTAYELSTSFWVIPWKIALGLLAFIILAGIGLTNTLKSMWKTGRKVLKL